MSKGPETRLQQRIQKAIRKAYPNSFFFKHWGGPFSPAGIPDLIGCVEGLFFGLEVKLPNEKRSKTSDIQDETIADIVNAGGCAGVVRSPQDALRYIDSALLDKYASGTPRRARNSLKRSM